jgi:hypothetical protein
LKVNHRIGCGILVAWQVLFMWQLGILALLADIQANVQLVAPGDSALYGT